MASSGGALSAAPKIIPKTTISIPTPPTPAVAVVGQSKPLAVASTAVDEFDDDFGEMGDWDAVMSQSAPQPSNNTTTTTSINPNTNKPAEKANPTTSIFGGGGGSTSIFGGESRSAGSAPPPAVEPPVEDDDELEAMYGF